MASCANDAIDAASLPARQSIAALQRVAQRYGRALGIALKDLHDALHPKVDHDAAPGRTFA